MFIRAPFALIVVAALLGACASLIRAEDATDNFITQLGSDAFETREKASAEIRKLGPAAISALLKRLKQETDPEMKSRLAALLVPRGLQIKTSPEFAVELKPILQIDELLKQFLSGEPGTQAEAEKALLDKSPFVAVVVREEIKGAATDRDTERLHALNYRLLSDSARNADRILQYAKALNTVARNNGPLKDTWDAPEVLAARNGAKIFHAAFIDPKIYAGKYSVLADIKAQRHKRTPYIDLPAAAQLYQCAQEMYERLAKAETDPAKAREFTALAESAKDLAANSDNTARSTK